MVNAGQRRFDRGQNAAKRHPNRGPKRGQRGQGDGDVIADVIDDVGHVRRMRPVCGLGRV